MMKISTERLKNFDLWKAEVLSVYPLISSEACWIAGGAVRNLFEGYDRPQQDIDFFTKEYCRPYLCDYLSNNGWVNSFESEHAITYTHSKVSYKAQVIKRNFSSIEQCLDTFDYTIAQCAYDGTDLTASPWTLHDIGTRKLVVHRFQHPHSSLRRMAKYAAYGYKPCHGTLVRLAQEIKASPLDEEPVWYVD